MAVEKYFIAFYRDINDDETKGEWRLSEDELEAERIHYEKIPHLKMKQIKTASIDKTTVEKIANENKMTIVEVLECV